MADLPPPPPGAAPPPPGAPAPSPQSGSGAKPWLLGLAACGGLFVLLLIVGALAGDEDDQAESTTTTAEPTVEPATDSTFPEMLGLAEIAESTDCDALRGTLDSAIEINLAGGDDAGIAVAVNLRLAELAC